MQTESGCFVGSGCAGSGEESRWEFGPTAARAIFPPRTLRCLLVMDKRDDD